MFINIIFLSLTFKIFLEQTISSPQLSELHTYTSISNQKIHKRAIKLIKC